MSSSCLSKSFYNQSTTRLAKNLLGCFLYTKSKQGITIGRIVETEAYLFKNDPACHAHKGKTKRNEAMFGPPGKAYVYLCYGMYNLFNVTSAKEGIGEAVLIRALEPVEGIEIMQKRRNNKNIKNLCNGPGKLVIALGINLKDNKKCLIDSNLKILPKSTFKFQKFKIDASPRIGISQAKELPLRFTIKDSKYLSC